MKIWKEARGRKRKKEVERGADRREQRGQRQGETRGWKCALEDRVLYRKSAKVKTDKTLTQQVKF